MEVLDTLQETLEIQKEVQMLDDLKDLIMALKSVRTAFSGHVNILGDLYCPPCGAARRMHITCRYTALTDDDVVSLLVTDRFDLKNLPPSLFTLSCVQCETMFTTLIYRGPDGPAVAVLPSCRGGLTTPHCPAGVSFYLDQAHRAESMGAYSAATAMFRGALEHLLFEQGYTIGMLNAKLVKLEADIGKGSAPKWAAELDTAFLQVLKDLGNGSIHPNDGDVTRQAALDGALLTLVREVFLYLLVLVYEAPHHKASALATLQAKAQMLKK